MKTKSKKELAIQRHMEEMNIIAEVAKQTGETLMRQTEQLISSAEAVRAKCQHTTPCSDCPWSRKALNGWLGGSSIDEWLATAHSDAYVGCHTLKGAQCAGIAIYRRNVCKSVLPPLLKLEADKEKVFSWPPEFRAHHEKLPGIKDDS